MARSTFDTATVDEVEDDELAQEIEAQVSEWSSNSNECFTVQLVRQTGPIAASFQPEFTYAMFGQEEAIFGYQDLSITLSFRAHDLQPKLDIKYANIFEAQGDVRPTDITEALRDFLPASTFDVLAHAQTDAQAFRPPGERVLGYKRDGKLYETWMASLVDPAAKALLENMQILVPMFIDGGSMLELEQEWTARRWKVFLLYQIDEKVEAGNSPYTLAGFGTSYRTFTFPERQKAVQFTAQDLEHYLPSPESPPNKLSNTQDLESPLDLPSRERLSQFLLLPPFQGAGHGQTLYETMYQELTQSPNVREFTVEDPNERFDDLRDYCDLHYLRARFPDFAALRINTDIPADKLSATANIPVDLIVKGDVRKQVMRQSKIMPRQFDRLVEMHTLSFIPHQHRSRSRITRKEKTTNEYDKAYYFWRLYVKHRLYIFNRDQLAQVEHLERVEKLESALDSVLEAYSEMIDKVETRERAIANGEIPEEETKSTNDSFSKRKRQRRNIVEEDGEDGEDGEPGAQQRKAPATANGTHKKVRVE